MEVIVRSATHEDAQSIAIVIAGSRRAYLPFAPLMHTEAEMRSWAEEVLIPTENVLVAELERKVIGVISTLYESGATCVSQLYVGPPFVSQGVGAKLLASGLHGVQTEVKLYTFQENVGARRFYKHHGFVEAELSDGSTTEEKVPRRSPRSRTCSLTHGSSGLAPFSCAGPSFHSGPGAAKWSEPLNLNVRLLVPSSRSAFNLFLQLPKLFCASRVARRVPPVLRRSAHL